MTDNASAAIFENSAHRADMNNCKHNATYSNETIQTTDTLHSQIIHHGCNMEAIFWTAQSWTALHESRSFYFLSADTFWDLDPIPTLL
jgi:hypothetical protein